MSFPVLPRLACLLAVTCLTGTIALPAPLAAQDGEVDTPSEEDEYDYQEPIRPELHEGIHPVIESPDGEPLIVVRVRTSAAWGRGPLRLLQREWPTVVDRAVDRRALPPEVRAELRETLVLSGQDRVVCTARLGTPRVVRRVSADFHYSIWSGEEGGRRYSAREVADAAWELAEGTELLVAPAIKVTGDCRHAGWATRRTPTFAPATTTDQARLPAAFRSLPEHRALAEAWTEASHYDDDPTATHWDERGGGSSRSFRSFEANGRRFALVVAHAHDGCGEFTGVVWALYEQPSEGLALRTSARTHTFVPDALVDLDGDGVPEILGGSQYQREGADLSSDVDPLFLGCPC